MRKIKRRKNSPRIKIKRRVGGPTKFTRSRRRVIYEALRNRLPQYRAVQLADISYSKYREWLILGRDPHNKKFHEFRKKVKRLLAFREQEALDIIRKVAKGGQQIKERKISRGPKGIETTTIRKMTQPHWKAAYRYLQVIGGAAYSKGAIEGFSEEEIPGQQKNVNLNVNGAVAHNVEMDASVAEQLSALRSLPIEELEKFATIVRAINNGGSKGTDLTDAALAAGGTSSGGEVTQTLH